MSCEFRRVTAAQEHSQQVVFTACCRLRLQWRKAIRQLRARQVPSDFRSHPGGGCPNDCVESGRQMVLKSQYCGVIDMRKQPTCMLVLFTYWSKCRTRFRPEFDRYKNVVHRPDCNSCAQLLNHQATSPNRGPGRNQAFSVIGKLRLDPGFRQICSFLQCSHFTEKA